MKQSKHVLFYLGALLLMIGGVVAVSTRHNRVEPSENQLNNQTLVPLGQLPEAQSPAIVELKDGDSYDLTAAPVKKRSGNSEVQLLAYNGSIPGPIIKVPQGAEVAINLTNQIDVPTTLHSHGVRLDSQFDGIPDVSQAPIQVGKTFTYKVKFPDPGVYWYHPHVREDYTQAMGLYGNYLVVPKDPSYWPQVNREEVLVLQDIAFDDGKVAPFSRTLVDHTLMGRFGNTMLVNGETNYKLQAQPGEIVRFYLTNAASVRPFNVTLPGAQLKLVGGDNGKYEREQWVDSVLLGPSERAVIDVLFPKAGSYTLTHLTPDKSYSLATITVAGDTPAVSYAKTFVTLKTNKDIEVSIDSLRPYFSKPADKRLAISLDMKGPGGMMGGGQHMMMGGMMMDNSMMTMSASSDGIEWEDSMATMNQGSTSQTLKWKLVDQDTGKVNEDIDWQFKRGDKVRISIFNDPKSMHPMQHPIHFHGQRFLVLSTNGTPNGNMVWKDSVLVPAGDTVELLVDMSNPGIWMAHCHIPEHLESGMMLKFRVD